MKKPIVHVVSHFVARVGVTRCGVYSDWVTADVNRATCKACAPPTKRKSNAKR